MHRLLAAAAVRGSTLQAARDNSYHGLSAIWAAGTRMFRIVYSSMATRPFRDGELRSMLHKFQHRNRARGITGLMVYYRNAFTQVLEGPEDKVRVLFERIAADPRHAQVTILQEETIESPDFPAWSMEYVGETHLRRICEDENMEQLQTSLTDLDLDTVLTVLRRARDHLQQHESGATGTVH